MKNAIILFLVFTSAVSYGQTVNGVGAQGPRERVISVAKSQVGVVEKSGNNDGPVDKYLASVGLEGTGAPYCAAFNRWVYDVANLRAAGPRSALAASWVQAPTWTRANDGRLPLPGDTWGIYFPAKKRVAHTGIVWVWGTKTVRTIEGNTSPDAVAGSAADRDGEGVYSKFRLINQIYSSKNWID